MSWDLTLSTGIALRQPLLQTLASMRQAGFTRVQVTAFLGHFDHHDPSVIAAVKEELRRLALQATSLHAPYSDRVDLTLMADSERAAAVAEVEAAARALAALGGRTIVLHPGSASDTANAEAQERLRQGVRSLTEIHRSCRPLGLTLAVEDMLGHLVGGRTHELAWVLSSLPRDGVSLCLDTGHSFLARSLFERVRMFGPRLGMLHAHDNRGVYDDHLPPGEGNIAWGPLLHRLHEVRFRGEIVLEIAEGPDVEQSLWRARRSVLFLQDLCRGKPYAVNLD